MITHPVEIVSTNEGIGLGGERIECRGASDNRRDPGRPICPDRTFRGSYLVPFEIQYRYASRIDTTTGRSSSTVDRRVERPLRRSAAEATLQPSRTASADALVRSGPRYSGYERSRSRIESTAA